MKIKFRPTPTILCLLLIVFASCDKGENELEQLTEEQVIDVEFVNSQIPKGATLVTDQKTIDLVRSVELDGGAISEGDFQLPDGSYESRIYIGGDLHIKRDDLVALRDFQQNGLNSRQYRTTNLVTGSNRTINILGYVANDANGLTTAAQSALQRAVANYNNLNITLQFNLTFGTNWQAADMVVYDTSNNNPNAIGGRAEFPTSTGRPGKFIQIYGTNQNTAAGNEHLITHEIGHCIGFRHTDWFDRQSCGENSNEGNAGVGAIYIEGTPSGRDLSSVMQACFNINNVSGNFNSNDITALGVMYAVGGEGSGPCDGVSEWRSNVRYSVGDRVTYFGNLYERGFFGWRLIGSC